VILEVVAKKQAHKLAMPFRNIHSINLGIKVVLMESWLRRSGGVAVEFVWWAIILDGFCATLAIDAKCNGCRSDGAKAPIFVGINNQSPASGT